MPRDRLPMPVGVQELRRLLSARGIDISERAITTKVRNGMPHQTSPSTGYRLYDPVAVEQWLLANDTRLRARGAAKDKKKNRKKKPEPPEKGTGHEALGTRKGSTPALALGAGKGSKDTRTDSISGGQSVAPGAGGEHHSAAAAEVVAHAAAAAADVEQGLHDGVDPAALATLEPSTLTAYELAEKIVALRIKRRQTLRLLVPADEVSEAWSKRAESLQGVLDAVARESASEIAADLSLDGAAMQRVEEKIAGVVHRLVRGLLQRDGAGGAL